MGYSETLEFHVDLASQVLGPQFEDNKKWLGKVETTWSAFARASGSS